MAIPNDLPAQFINWLVVDRNGKKTKVPCDVNGHFIDAHDQKNWLDFDSANASAYSVGFVISDDDSFFFLDLDKCDVPLRM